MESGKIIKIFSLYRKKLGENLIFKEIFPIYFSTRFAIKSQKQKWGITMNKNHNYLLILLVLLFSIKIYGQDSLYLVGTITGELGDKRITGVKCIGDINGDGYEDFIISRTYANSAELYLGSSHLKSTS